MKPGLFKLEAIFEEYEHAYGMNVLGASDAKSLTLGELLNISARSLHLERLELGYCAVKGTLALRAAIAACYSGADISPEQVLITVGGSEAIFLALNTLLKPCDRALVCHPVYQGLSELIKTAGAQVVYYSYREECGFAPDMDEVRRAFKASPPPKVLILNTPHNPTGHVMDEGTLADLMREARAAGVQVVADEVFSGIWINSTRPVPSAVTLDSSSIVIGCLSKVYGLAGLRVGWLIGSKEFINDCKNLRYYTSLTPPAIVQDLAEIAIWNRELILERTQDYVNKNYAFAQEWLETQQTFFEWFPPQGGMVMLLRLKRSMNTEQFARDLAEKHGVFLLPCTVGFDMPEGYLRLGLGSDPDRFKKGLQLVDEFLNSLP